MLDYEILDEALISMAPAGPDLRNGLTNHAPMAAEALVALRRGDTVMRWLENYRKGLTPRPSARERIQLRNWRAALAHSDRFTDWRELFDCELKEAPWQTVLEKWAARLGPGMSASATHGVIRTGHAVRALVNREAPARLQELADGLALWASTYQELPSEVSRPLGAKSPMEAICLIPILPAERRKFSGTITSSLNQLDRLPEFAPVIGLIDIGGTPSVLMSKLTRTFAHIYLANAHNLLNVIVFIHAVTCAAAVRKLLPSLSDATSRAAMQYAWQTGCALYAAFGASAAVAEDPEPVLESDETLIDMAIACGDEHAIKFTEACLSENAITPSSAYLAAARHAVQTLKA